MDPCIEPQVSNICTARASVTEVGGGMEGQPSSFGGLSCRCLESVGTSLGPTRANLGSGMAGSGALIRLVGAAFGPACGFALPTIFMSTLRLPHADLKPENILIKVGIGLCLIFFAMPCIAHPNFGMDAAVVGVLWSLGPS